jgi:hypothetical protein
MPAGSMLTEQVWSELRHTCFNLGITSTASILLEKMIDSAYAACYNTRLQICVRQQKEAFIATLLTYTDGFSRADWRNIRH